MQERDHLESFIEANREAFDHAWPGLQVWAEIDRQISGKAQKRSPLSVVRILRVAAAVLVLLVCGGVIGAYLSGAGQQPTEIAAVEEVSPDLAEMIKYYNEEIDQKFARLARYPEVASVKADLSQIDEAMEELKQELANAPKGKEAEIVSNLIKSYQLKVQILERVLERLQDVNGGPPKTADNEISI